MHEESTKELGFSVQTGWSSFLDKVMGWWAFDVFTQMAVFTGNDDYIASQTILRNIGLFTYMIPVGLM